MYLKFFIIFSVILFSNVGFAKPSGKNYVDGEILVKFKNSLSLSEQKSAISKKGGAFLSRSKSRGPARVKINKNIDLDKMIADFKKDPNVEYAQPNYIYQVSRVPADTRYGQLWGLKNSAQTIVSANGPDEPTSTNNPGTSGRDMNLEYAWETITDCSSVIVAVLDTGINYNHEDLLTNLWNGGVTYPKHGYDFIDNDSDPMDSHGHGTHVAGTIGAIGNNNKGTTGICWKAKIMAVRVLGTTGAGTTAGIIDGIDFAVDNGAKVINMSLGGGSFDAAYNLAINKAQTNGVLVVAAAGNESENNEEIPSYPCNFSQDNILCVAALDQKYALASFSNFGATSVDVGAPGVNILSSWPGSFTQTEDPLIAGWTFSSNSATVWDYLMPPDLSGFDCLANPSNYDRTTAKYDNNTNATAWKSFSIPSASTAATTANFYLRYALESNKDFFYVYAKSGNQNPEPDGDLLDFYTGTSGEYFGNVVVDLTPYAGGQASVGFNLTSDGSGVDFGSNVCLFSIDTLTYTTNIYNVISGTSMAAPHVAGLAAMIFAYNPNYTYSDVVNSIKNGGVAIASLSGKSTTGKAVSAIGSLNYISTPVGGTAVVVP